MNSLMIAEKIWLPSVVGHWTLWS